MNNKEEILAKVDEIINFIKENKTYQDYLKAKDILNNESNLMELINHIKNYQKLIVNKKINSKDGEKKIKECLDILNEEPIYLQFIELQKEVNNMLIIFENKINKYFEDVFN